MISDDIIIKYNRQVLGRFNMIVLLTPYPQCCFRTIVTLNDILRSGKHDDQQHLSQSQRQDYESYLPFIIPHVHISFPLNHIFQDYISYSIEYKPFNYEYGNIIIQILLPLGHIYNSLPLALESIIQLHAFLTPIAIWCCSCFPSGRAFITGSDTLQILM